MTGGAGNDIYIVDDAGDLVIEAVGSAGGTADEVRSFLDTYTLAANVERLTLLSGASNGNGNILGNTITGNGDNNDLFGDSGNDSLVGGAGNDTLEGGVGKDTLVGGIGDDLYIVDGTDSIVETGADTADEVQAGLTFSLALLTKIENLTLTGSGDFNGTGNTLDNLVNGNSGDNVLTGGGGLDTLAGGDGNDTYVVDSLTDQIWEGNGVDSGLDTVNFTGGTGVTFSLESIDNVENLTLLGTNATNGTGNGLDNILVGNAKNNTLIGLDGADRLDGGAGNDTMIGGDGNDTYFANATTDVVREESGGSSGIDTVNFTSATIGQTYTLSNDATFGFIENLTLGGTARINGVGNDQDNTLTGNGANNSLTAGAGDDTILGGGGVDTISGGLGHDTLTGGTGND
eukprot:gene61959-biopygen35100